MNNLEESKEHTPDNGLDETVNNIQAAGHIASISRPVDEPMEPLQVSSHSFTRSENNSMRGDNEANMVAERDHEADEVVQNLFENFSNKGDSKKAEILKPNVQAMTPDKLSGASAGNSEERVGTQQFN